MGLPAIELIKIAFIWVVLQCHLEKLHMAAWNILEEAVTAQELSIYGHSLWSTRPFKIATILHKLSLPVICPIFGRIGPSELICFAWWLSNMALQQQRQLNESLSALNSSILSLALMLTLAD